MKEKENENTNACGPFLVDCCQLSTVSFLHLILTIASMITMSQSARTLDRSNKEIKAVVNWLTMLQRRRARVQFGITGNETALTRGHSLSHSVSAPRFSAIKLDQTGIL